MAEWLKAAVSKTVMGHWPIESSNLSLSATLKPCPVEPQVPDLSVNLTDRLPDGRPVKRFYAVQEFFLTYLHPDWRLDDPSPDAVVARFRRQAAESVPALADELEELAALPVLDDVLRDHVLRRYDLNYDPQLDGLTMRQWLQHVGATLRGSGSSA